MLQMNGEFSATGEPIFWAMELGMYCSNVFGTFDYFEQSTNEWTAMDFASSTRAAENRSRWKGIVAKQCCK